MHGPGPGRACKQPPNFFGASQKRVRQNEQSLWVTLGNCISASLYIRIALLFVSVTLPLSWCYPCPLHSMALRIAPREVLVERFGNLKLPLGGKYEYKGVRGKQGRARNRFQGYTPRKSHTTELYDTSQEAAVALAKLNEELAMGYDPVEERKPRKKRGSLFRMRNPSRPASLRAPL